MIRYALFPQQCRIQTGKRSYLENAPNKKHSAKIGGARVKPGLIGKPSDFVRKFPSLQKDNVKGSLFRRQAELDFIDFTRTNGVYAEEVESTEEMILDESAEFKDLDRDVEELEEPEEQKPKMEFRALKAFFAYLADAKEFGKRGEALVLITFATYGFIVVPPFVFKGVIPFLSIVSILGGALCAVLGVVNLGSSFSPLPVAREENALVQTGIFKFIRHPLYAGLLMLSAGLSILSGNEFRLLMTGVLWWLIEETIRGEEKELEDLHPEYAEYKTKVGKLLPQLS